MLLNNRPSLFRMACKEPAAANMFDKFLLEITHRVVAVIGSAAGVAAHRRLVVFPDLEVQVDAGAVTGCAGAGNALPPGHHLADSDKQAAHVSIKRHGAVAVIEHQAVSVTAVPAGKYNLPLGRRQDIVGRSVVRGLH